MADLLHSYGLVVREDSGRITFRERQGLNGAIGAGLLVIGLGLVWLTDGGLAPPSSLLGWLGWIVTALAVLLLIVSAVRASRGPNIVDGLGGRIRVGGKTLDFTRVTAVKLSKTFLGDQERYGLTIETIDGDLKLLQLLPASELPALEKVRDRTRELIAGASAASGASEDRDFAIDTATGRQLFAAITFFGGLGLALAVYFAAPDLAFTRGNVGWGLLVWPLGIWMMVLGIAEWSQIPLYRWLHDPPFWRRALVFVVWFGSYVAFALVRTGE